MSARDEIYRRVTLELSDARNAFWVFTAIAAFVALIVITCLIGIGKAIAFYIRNRKSKFLADMVKSRNRDNYENEEVYKDRKDDYIVFNQSIDTTLSEYIDYNERLKRWYKDNRPEDTPEDLIDRNILDASNDNY